LDAITDPQGVTIDPEFTMISAQAKVAALAAELEKRGFVVDKITAWSGQPRPQVPVRKLPPSALALRRSRDTVDLP
jgi:hypothetical protein